MTSETTSEFEFSKKTPDHRQYAFVRMSVHRASDFGFVSNARWPDSLSSRQIADFEGAVEAGAREALNRLDDPRFEIELTEIRFDLEASSQMAFKIAATLCVQDFYGRIILGRL